MLDRLLVKLASLAFAAIGLVMLNNQVLDGALYGCFLRDSVDLPGSETDLFGGALDVDRVPPPASVPRIGR